MAKPNGNSRCSCCFCDQTIHLSMVAATIAKKKTEIKDTMNDGRYIRKKSNNSKLCRIEEKKMRSWEICNFFF